MDRVKVQSQRTNEGRGTESKVANCCENCELVQVQNVGSMYVWVCVYVNNV